MSFNLEIFSLVVCLTSFLGLLFFLYKKVPVLTGLPEREIFPFGKIKEDVRHNLKLTFRERLHNFEAFLQKKLQKSRVLFLRADNKATHMISRLRERADKRKVENEAHWKDIRFTFPIKKHKAK